MVTFQLEKTSQSVGKVLVIVEHENAAFDAKVCSIVHSAPRAGFRQRTATA